ncbi:LysR substrate-binding domain-containing protein [Ochrobactrum quorumnocens]|uniref:LysR family transcriptional regulator n=1 Tax=Ochrobactrum quorumnocens TaxID=271865 RepID=A0A5N1JFM9_9HYPH|nr:LysR substrate-binding domain-containing protein [[Ochrobactrum] quorumnocens]KAA9354281.1 LysR family transcriptional regulator [[Ochrobactrum] quorumnocens]
MDLKQENNRLPPLQTLQSFSVVADTGSFTAAANQLNISQSAISRQIQLLEHYFGCSLFDRHTRKVLLTEQGRALLPIINGLMASLKNSFEATKRPSRTLTIRMPPTLARRWFLPRLPDLLRRHPDLNINIDTAWFARPNFSIDDIDMLITYGNGSWPGMVVIPLVRESLTPMCAPSLISILGRPANIAKLAECVLIHSNPRHSDWMLWLQAEGAYSLRGSRNQVFDTQDFAMTAAASGFGVTMGDRTFAKDDLASGVLLQPFPRILETGYGYYALFPDRKDHRDRIRELSSWFDGQAIQRDI